MRILYLITRYWPAIGGAELHTRELVHHLASRGHKITVATHWDSNRTDWLLGTTITSPGSTLRYQDGTAASVVRMGYAPRRRARTLIPAATYYARLPQAAQALAQQIEADLLCWCGHDWDVIHGVRSGREPLYLAGYQLARRLGIPYVFTPLHHPRWVGYRYRVYIDLYRSADAVIALTKQEQTQYESFGVAAERITISGVGPIVPPTADAERFRAAHHISGPLVLFLGQKYAYKGYKTLLEAATKIWGDHPDTTFAFLGPRTPASRHAFAAVRDQRIIELDTVDLQTKGDALDACDIFCLPSEQESFGGVYTEAWSYAKPVVGSAIPAVQELISDGVDGLIAQPRNASSFARCIVRLLDDVDFARRLGANGRAKVQTAYSWPQVAARVERAYLQARGRATVGRRE